jgi:hypothetical protein
MVPLFKCQVLAAAGALVILSTHRVGQSVLIQMEGCTFHRTTLPPPLFPLAFILKLLGWDVNVRV